MQPIGVFDPEANTRMFHGHFYERPTVGCWQFGGPAVVAIGESLWPFPAAPHPVGLHEFRQATDLDLTSIDPVPCACGRTTVRIARITGRTDDMLIVRGVNVYPSQIEHALLQVSDVEPHYLIVLRREGTLDSLEVQVEARAIAAEAGRDGLRALGAVVRRKLYEVLGLTADVTVVPPKSIERSVGKAQRVRDLRQRGEGS